MKRNMFHTKTNAKNAYRIGYKQRDAFLTFDQVGILIRSMGILLRSFTVICAVAFLYPQNSFADEDSDAAFEPSVVEEIGPDQKVESAENKVSPEDDEDVAVKKPDPNPVLPPKGHVPEPLIRLGSGEFFSKYAFLLDKSRRTLTVWEYTNEGLKLVETHASDYGRVEGDKRILGDKKTPEGVYFFQSMYEGGNLDYNEYGSRAFVMDYPNLFDRREKKTGSGIWLHAIPETKSLLRGSRGCIVVRDAVIKKLAQYITLKKTPIVVQESVKYLKPESHQTQQAQLLAWLDRWRESWESMQIESYINFYSDDFLSLNMNIEQWRRYKESLSKKYDFIKVRIGKPIVYLHNNEAVIRFLQAYESDKNSDFGEKVLYLKKDEDSNEYKIIAERWSPLSNKLIALLESKETSL